MKIDFSVFVFCFAVILVLRSWIVFGLLVDVPFVMDLESTSASAGLVKCCDCDCTCNDIMNRSLSGTMLRSVKRKIDEDENKFFVPGLNLPHVARVEMDDEVAALREAMGSQQATIQDLSVELDEERNASSSAANEAMSMILRLQREKAEVQMESRQFKRFAEEKMAHDQQEIVALEDLLYKREQQLQSLTCEVQAYKHRMMSYGLTESEADGEGGSIGRLMSRNNSHFADDNLDNQFDFPAYDYPPLKCNLNESHVYSEVDNEMVYDIEKYAFGETPKSLKDLEQRINQLERTPRSIQPDGEFFGTKNVLEKVIVGHSPRKPRLSRKLSTNSTGSVLKDMGSEFSTDSPRFGGSIRKTMYSQPEEYSNVGKGDNSSNAGDDMSDRVYTIDSVYQGSTEPKATIGIYDDYMTTPRESRTHMDIEDPDVKKMYMRLQALEADKESMRQALISMRTDKAQLILLKEIAQHFYKDMSPSRAPVKKPSIVGAFSFLSVVKWVASYVFWKKKARKSRYMFGMSPQNAGMLMLLDKGSRVPQWRCLSRTQL